MKNNKRRQASYLEQLNQELDRHGQTIANLKLRDGRKLRLTITQVSRGLFRGSYLRTAVWEGASCCVNCREQIEKLKYYPSDLLLLLQNAETIFLACSDNCRSNSEAQTTAGPPRVRVSPDSDENRIKVISQGNSTNLPAPVAQEPNTPNVIKVKKPNVKVLTEAPAESHLTIQVPRADSRDAAKHVYGAPSIRYRVKQNYEVEVTIPRYLCEQIIYHCSESKRSRREVGGILVGYTSETHRLGTGATFTHNNVTDLLEVKASNSSNSHLTIDEDTWASVLQTFEARYGTSGKVKFGWYHTHPHQGIFFSPQDKDTHTIFTLPYQFALVIDPRSMLAGLFAWSDYEQRTMVESHHFPLKLRSETSDSYNDPGDSGDRELDPNVFSSWRIFLFGIMFLGVLSYVLLSSEPTGLGPNQAILLALISFLGLRLWNAHFFDPSVLVEKEAFTKIVQDIRTGGSLVGKRLVQHPNVAIVLSILAGGLLVLGLGYTGAWLYINNQVARITLPAQVQTVNSPAVSTPTQVSTPRSILLTTKMASKTLLIASRDPVAEIVYIQKGATWTPDASSREKKFFQSVFGFDLKHSDQLHMGLQPIPQADGKVVFTFNGEWNDVTRNAFISQLPGWKTARKISVRTPAGEAILSIE
jgi:proteasome lid subunit RPN8/RPN11